MLRGIVRTKVCAGHAAREGAQREQPSTRHQTNQVAGQATQEEQTHLRQPVFQKHSTWSWGTTSNTAHGMHLPHRHACLPADSIRCHPQESLGAQESPAHLTTALVPLEQHPWQRGGCNGCASSLKRTLSCCGRAATAIRMCCCAVCACTFEPYEPAAAKGLLVSCSGACGTGEGWSDG